MFIKPNYELLTTRCRLRYPHKDDIPHIWSATRFPGFNEGMLWDPPTHPDELLAPLQRNIEAWDRAEDFTWSIVELVSSDFLGRISIRREASEGEWSIGFWIHPQVQGRGFATEAAAAMIDFGFLQLEAQVISAAHATWNVASGKVLTQIGMQQLRVNPHGFKKHGVWVEELEYAVESSAWSSGREHQNDH